MQLSASGIKEIRMQNFYKIIAHNDFDGVVSAAIISRAMGVDRFMFAGPRVITNSRITITKEDIVCDLPYPLECGLWFDHHEGNFEDVRLRGIDPSTIDGRFEKRDSCARVVYEFFSAKTKLPEFYADTVQEADVLDSFKFTSIEDWRRETPGKIVDGAINGLEGPPRQRDNFLRELVRLIRDHSLVEVAGQKDVVRLYGRYLQLEEKIMETIKKEARFLEKDPSKEVVVIDFTSYNRSPRVIKKLTFLLFPDAKAVIEVRNPMRGGVKTRDVSISMSLGICLSGVQHSKNVGEIMRELNIGDGHAGAGAGMVNCSSRAEMLSEKERLVEGVLKLWKSQ